MSTFEIRSVGGSTYQQVVCVRHNRPARPKLNAVMDKACKGVTIDTYHFDLDEYECPLCEAEKQAKENPVNGEDVNKFKALQDQIDRLRENIEKLKAVEPPQPDFCTCEIVILCPCCGKPKKKDRMTIFGNTV